MQEGPWLVMSRLVGVLRCPDGGGIVTHVLGQHRLSLSAEALEQLLTFRLPRRAGSELSSPLIQSLLNAKILRVAGGREGAWIQAAAARSATLQSGALEGRTPILSFGHTFFAPPMQAFPDEGLLRLSTALAVSDLGANGVLVTHPLGCPTHLAHDVWRFARSFSSPRRVPKKFYHAATFLARRRLLWPVEAEERASAELVSPTTPFQVETPTTSLFWQFWRPFEIDQLNRPTRDVSLIVIGPCLAHQHLEILTHFSLCHGLRIACEGDLEASTELLAKKHDIIFYHPGKFSHALTQVATMNDFDRANVVLSQIRSAVGRELEAIRGRSAQPLIMPLFARPRVTSTRPGDAMDLWLDGAYGELNAQLGRFAQEDGSVRIIDELRERDILGVGRYKDDLYNAASHNAPIANWSLPIVKPNLQKLDPSQVEKEIVPPLTSGQVDPSAVLAVGILRLVLQITWEMPQVGIVIEPDELLWSGRLDNRHSNDVLRHLLTVSSENDFYAGIHEALVGLSLRGVPIWLRTASTTRSVNALMDILEAYPQLLKRQRWAGILARENGEERLISGYPPRNEYTVLINFANSSVWRNEGHCFPAELRWRLREYLLTAPELYQKAPPPDAGPRPDKERSSTTGATDRQRIAKLLDKLVAETAGIGLDVAAETDHLADLGLDSLSIVQVIAGLEEQLGVVLPTWAKLRDTAYRKSRLCEAFATAAAAAVLSPAARLFADHA